MQSSLYSKANTLLLTRFITRHIGRLTTFMDGPKACLLKRERLAYHPFHFPLLLTNTRIHNKRDAGPLV